MATTIQVEEDTKRRLQEIKLHPAETYNEVINRLVKDSEEDAELSDQSLDNIRKSLEDIKHGRTLSTEEVKKRLRV